MLTRFEGLVRRACGQHRPWVIGGLATALAVAAYLAYFGVRFGLNAPTRATGDEPDYDSIAWELSQGRGFSVNYLDPEFRRPYEAAAASPLYRLESRRQGVTTYRPPLFPWAVAAGNVLFGRQFWAMRVLNAAAMGLCCGLLCAAISRSFCTRAALAAGLIFVVLDSRTRLYASAFLTESLAALGVALLAVVLVHGVGRRVWQTALAGLVTGFMILTRPMFILWLPWLVAIIVLTVRRKEAAATWIRATQHGLAYLAIALLVLLPWGIRNCVTLQRFMPLGSQAAIELSAAWGDGAWAHRGEWRRAQPVDFFEPDPAESRSLAEREVAAADESVARARDWIVAHPGKAAALIPIKIFQEFRPKDWSQAVLLGLAFIGAVSGCRVARDREICCHDMAIGFTFVAAQALGVGLTWSVPESRFVVPLLFVEHFFAVAGLMTLARLWQKRPIT